MKRYHFDNCKKKEIKRVPSKRLEEAQIKAFKDLLFK